MEYAVEPFFLHSMAGAPLAALCAEWQEVHMMWFPAVPGVPVFDAGQTPPELPPPATLRSALAGGVEASQPSRVIGVLVASLSIGWSPTP